MKIICRFNKLSHYIKDMTFETGIGMLVFGLVAILIGSIFAYIIINRVMKNREFEEGINNCKNGKEIEEFLKKWSDNQ